MIISRLKGWLTWSWTYLWALWFILVMILLYILRGPLKITESIDGTVLQSASSYFNNLTPKFYVALTGTSSLVSGVILIFEWWYFKNNAVELTSEDGSDNDDSIEQSKQMSDCKVWRNPMALLRGAEYRRVKESMKLEPLTYYDMNLTAQDQQSFFTSDEDTSRPDLDIMAAAWRERDTATKVNAAREALRINPECAPALVLLAEEDCQTVAESEMMLRRALKATETSLSSSQHYHNNSTSLVPHDKLATELYRQGARRRDLNMMVYIRRRMAMCLRKQGKLREAIKIFKDILRESQTSLVLGVQENLIEACLEMQAYADVQVLLVRYDGYDSREPRSAAFTFTSALLKARTVADRFAAEGAHRRGISSAEAAAVEAITRAIEYNPHVPMYLLEQKPMILPPEHYLKRGDSEAIAYAFYHIQHWKRIEGSLHLLKYTWRGDFIEYASRFQLSGYCYPYNPAIEAAERELLPQWHKISVFPKRESALKSATQSLFCVFTMILALLAHFFPANAWDFVASISFVINSFLSSFGDLLLDVIDGASSVSPSRQTATSTSSVK